MKKKFILKKGYNPISILIYSYYRYFIYSFIISYVFHGMYFACKNRTVKKPDTTNSKTLACRRHITKPHDGDNAFQQGNDKITMWELRPVFRGLCFLMLAVKQFGKGGNDKALPRSLLLHPCCCTVDV
jgi:hypothetical protein